MSGGKTTRRHFMRSTAAAGAGFWFAGMTGCATTKPKTPKARYKSPNEKLNVACIGIGGKGASDVRDCRSENIVALCDVDWTRGRVAIKQFGKAAKYHDYRKMFDEMHRRIDAVTVSTPDHMHAAPSIMAMRYGMHVFCQKPLTHDISESRLMAKTARECGVATQMGNQGTADDKLRRAVEAIQAGAIGKVREAHIWTNRPVWPQGMARPEGSDPIPSYLKWDLWLGVAPVRPYKQGAYHPFNWRGWWDFGTGALGDMGCHTANVPFMALKLDAPVSAEAQNSGFDKESFPTWSVIKLEFGARGDLPPLTWTWYDGGDQKPKWVLDKLAGMIHGEELSSSGSILVGDKGTFYSPHSYGGRWVLLPKKQFEGWKPPPRALPESPGHVAEWIRACKGGPKPMANFDYAAPLTETLLLGNIATYTGKKILWDAANCRITNCPEGQALIQQPYRKGWEI